jgi:hypothetical protein
MKFDFWCDLPFALASLTSEEKSRESMTQLIFFKDSISVK